MDLLENPRKRRKNPKKNGGKKRRAKAKKVSVTTRTQVRANPRRARRRNPAKSVRRRRRNPGGGTWMQMGAAGLGALAGYGIQMGVAKIPKLSGYTFLAVDSLAPAAAGIAAAYMKAPNVGQGLVAVAVFKTAQNLQTAWSLYQATKAAAPKPAASGLAGLPMGAPRFNPSRNNVVGVRF